MNTTFHRWVAVAAMALVAGCATTFRPWMLSEVHEGMDKAAVVKLLGDPDYTEPKDGAEHLYYTYSESYTAPVSSDSAHAADASRELKEMAMKRSLQEYRYVVILVDGKVLNYKELED